MLSVQISSIPDFLKDSYLFESLEKSDNGADDLIFIPEDCFLPSLDQASLHTLPMLLNSMRFWIVKSIPTILYDLSIGITADVDCEYFQEICTQLRSDLPALYCLGEIGLVPQLQQIDHAISYGELEIVKFLHSRGREWTKNSCVIAASTGSLSCLRFARLNGANWDRRAPEAALETNSVACLEYCLQEGCPCDLTVLCIEAVSSRRTHCVEVLLKNNAHATQELAKEAILVEDMSILCLIMESGCTYSDDLTATAMNVAWAAGVNYLQYIKTSATTYAPTLNI